LADNSINSQLQAGIAAAKAGDKASARELLEAVLAKDDRNELAWIWLASVVATVRERRICLERVLAINPRNERARTALAQLGGTAPLPNPAAPTTAVNPTYYEQPQGGRSPRLALYVIGAFVLVIFGINLFSTLFSPRVVEAPIPTITPLPAEILAQIFTPTPAPTTTAPIVLVTVNPATLPPTFTPTFTPTPEPTLFPSPTAFPLGQYTVYYTSRGSTEATFSLRQMLVDGTGDTPLLENVEEIVFDATGQQVAFVREVRYPASEVTPLDPEVTVEPTSGEVGALELFVANVNDLANARQVTSLKNASVQSPAFSPNGQQIAFVSDYTGSQEIFLLDLASNTTTQLTDNDSIDRDPDWSPDGSSIVFASDRESPLYLDLFLLTFNADGTNRITRLTEDLGSSYSPRFSPDGRQIVYVNDNTGDGDVFVMSADGQRQTSIVSDEAEDRFPVWSADGRFVAFVSNREDNLFQMYLIEPPNRTVTRINRDDRETGNLQFRPDLIFRIVGENN
jgi:TolB protein